MIITPIQYTVRAEYAAENQAYIRRILEDLRISGWPDIGSSIFVKKELSMPMKSTRFFKKMRDLFSLLGLLLLASPKTAFAASTHPHHLTRAQDGITNINNCPAAGTYGVVIVTNGGWSVDCFDGVGSESVGLYNVTALETNFDDLAFTWLDSNGHFHTTDDPPGTFLSAGMVPGKVAESGSISEITSITLTVAESYTGGGPYCSPSYDDSAWIATNTSSASPYYALCYITLGTYSVRLYGVYAIETGDFTVSFTWLDYHNQLHTSSLGYGVPGTLLAAGNAGGGSGGFAGSDRIAVITSITLS
jgi:hypothetical protein